MASLAARNAPVLLWARRPELAERIATAHENPDYLAGLALHPELRATSSLPVAAEQADVIIMAVPTHAFRQTPAELAPHVRPWIPLRRAPTLLSPRSAAERAAPVLVAHQVSAARNASTRGARCPASVTRARCPPW